MTFLSPYWLFAAAAVLVPIAIHLWNKRQGKTVKVGSLRWLEPSASKRWSSIKLSEVWLLVLRCCILLLLAAALAKPVWEGALKAEEPRKAVFISPELLHSPALTNIKPTVDALLQRGYTLHRYTANFESISAEAWQTLSSTPTDSVVSNGNHWGLLPAVAQQYDSAQDSVWLFTSDQQRHFSGAPTSLQENIRWVPVALESTTNWVQSAYTLSPDSLLLIVSQSTREGTRYSQKRIASSGQTTNLNGSLLQLAVQGDSLLVQRNGSSSQKVLLRKGPLRIDIAYNEAQQSEVRYLQAAVQAISRYTGIPIETQQIPNKAPTDASANWLFWLRDEEVPDTWLEHVQQNGASVWVQPGSEPEVATSHLAASGIEKIRVHQLSAGIADSKRVRTTAGIVQANATPIWQTTAGEPLLSMQRLGLGRVYHFRSGFGPAWSQLGQSAQLPELLLPLLLPQQGASHYDARALDEMQLQPALVRPISKPDKVEKKQYSLIPWLGLLAFLLFLAERIIATKRKTA